MLDVNIPVGDRVQVRRIERSGWADRLFVFGGKVLFLAVLAMALLLPLLAIFWRGFSNDMGQGGGLAAARQLLASEHFHWLLGNSLRVSLTVAIIVVPLAYVFAYALQRTLIPAKGLWRAISLLPLLAPSMLPAIALIYLFGNQGLLRGLFADNIYGFWGIVIGEVIYTFPHALMILLSALSLSDARLFDAASSMGASAWRSFHSITWPASRQAVFAAFCLVFTLTITDFGVPVIVGGHRGLQGCGGAAAVRSWSSHRYGLAGARADQLFHGCLVAPAPTFVHEWPRAGIHATAFDMARWRLSGDRRTHLHSAAGRIGDGGVFLPSQVLALQPVVVAQALPVQ